MRSKYILIALVLVTLGFGVGRLSAAVGTLDSPDVPGNTQSFTLEDIYNRLTTGNFFTQSTFQEPGSGPGTGTMHTLNDIMAVAVPGAIAKRVPKTGQTTSYATGDDGDYEMGITPAVAPGDPDFPYDVPDSWTGIRFTDNGDGTVTDNLTALIWLQNASCFGVQTWTQALSDANGLASGDCDLTDNSSAGDWRLPNFNELHSLVPSWPPGNPFTGVQSWYYWSSTTYAGDTSEAWCVLLHYSYVYYATKNCNNYVWPVRGGQ